MDATALLRPGLLEERVVALGGGGSQASLAGPLAALGARTAVLPATLDEDAMTAAVDPATDVLVHDLRPAFVSAAGAAALRAALDLAWVTARAVANAAFIAGSEAGLASGRPDAGPASSGHMADCGTLSGGKVTLIAPADAGWEDPAVTGVRAAAENLARTLSIEWARHGVTTVAVTPGAGTDDAQLAALVAYLASPAGDYFSGCRLALGEVARVA
jgi:NAD(P)-dependent dehydrogenase (short-subunit alcohol dehydrogenase family)